jgi:O-methyltransferase
MDLSVIYELADVNSDMTDIDRLVTLYWVLSQQLYFDVPGEIVELGCNAGLTSSFLQMIIDESKADRELHVYDSFLGLPRPGPQDAYLEEGDCATTVESLTETFARRGLRPPRIHPGWFSETLPRDLPEAISFAYLDGDFYDSVKLSLEAVWPRLATSGSILIDDYGDSERNPRAWCGLPGVKTACDEFFAGREAHQQVLIGNGDLAMIHVRKLA